MCTHTREGTVVTHAVCGVFSQDLLWNIYDKRSEAHMKTISSKEVFFFVSRYSWPNTARGGMVSAADEQQRKNYSAGIAQHHVRYNLSASGESGDIV